MVSKKEAREGNRLNNQMIKLENRKLIKVELLFTGDKSTLEAIKEHLVDSINKDFIKAEKNEVVVIKNIEELK